MTSQFQTLLIEKDEAGKQRVDIRRLDEDALPDGDVTVQIEWSTLNYKDALAITGRGPIVRKFPMVPGIDFAGTVVRSTDPALSPGDQVVLNGWGVGEKHWGGLAGRARVRADWLVPLPDGLSTRQAMAIGTAGYTAMLSVMALERGGIRPNRGPIAVSGASGGVGSIAVMLLSRLGYTVEAITGRSEEGAYLTALGAAAILPRDEFTQPGKPLAQARWAGAVDVAGGRVLANICAGMATGGVVTACGLAAGMDFPVTVAPFILRGVSLIGIDSVYCQRERRITAWNRLAELLDPHLLDTMTTEIALADVPDAACDLMDGRIRGRVIVNTGSAI
ncbi:alcohol dehydrogenase [Acetobacter nitrogenifigens DSM 23921 = NBRC 105050]|uniref:Alcohol dehydrogenase n=1 Tax=Acetobacter nitrogenifigens DSM 23921 = NBRC 105050 TaxID=1120919 RepID=A0A511XAH6_9PROT|nr:MDR family oxidoreductase [Acetobacter nitrogenifigens]GBQ91170.1 alcohol dehydrogenase [Acetobacter nitrogenifigens DSM 23921 = NBRC 105050]GEN59967.1 alcohol dehydrogenase [Acetobacter nitrogenifigens DSM 23921 = NBRC 105050]